MWSHLSWENGPDLEEDRRISVTGAGAGLGPPDLKLQTSSRGTAVPRHWFHPGTHVHAALSVLGFGASGRGFLCFDHESGVT